MSDALSQDEVNALLRGLADGEVPADGDAEAARGEVRRYDLVGEERLVARRFPALDLVHERFARRLRRSLGSFAGTSPHVELAPLQMLKFGTFRNRLPTPSSLHLFTMAPLRGHALLVVSAPLAFGIVDRVFGGAGRAPASLAAREYSAIEMQMIQRFVGRALVDLSESWTPVHGLACVFGRSELNPASVAICGPADMTLVLDLDCDLGGSGSRLTLAVPYAMLEPLRAKLGEPQAAAGGPDRDWLGALTRVVRDTVVLVSAELGTREISTREVLRLKVGDVLALGTRSDDPLDLKIEGVPLLAAVPGVSRGNNAVRVLPRD
jgi:flagellar motor switch protein FliM